MRVPYFCLACGGEFVGEIEPERGEPIGPGEGPVLCRAAAPAVCAECAGRPEVREATARLRRLSASIHGDRPACGHSACRQYWIDTGCAECVDEYAKTARARIEHAETLAAERRRRNR